MKGEQSTKQKTVIGFLWVLSEKFGTQLLQMGIFIILARMLSPEDFGLMGMLAVFIGVSQSLTDSGFGQALIQNKDTDDIDYSSVFFINLLFSLLVYILIFLTAPLISSFYDTPILKDLVRVLGLRFIISAFFLVQVSRMTKNLEFKKLLFSRLPATFAGGVAGIGSAYAGLGVWSLVVLQLTDVSVYALQIWRQAKWRPFFVFQFERVKMLFRFGGNMMLEGVLGNIVKNMYELIIGKYYSVASVGFFTQANRLKQLPIDAMAGAIGNVTFPILVGFQEDDERLRKAYRQIMRQIFFFVSPIMVAAIVVAEPLFSLVLTDKWLPAVPFFQVLCLGAIFYPAQVFNLNILKVKGRSDLFLYLGFIKKGLTIAGVLFFAQYSVLGLVIFSASFSLIALFINSYYSGRLIKYGMIRQLTDICRFIFGALMSGMMVFYVLSNLQLDKLITIVVGFSGIMLCYLAIIFCLDRKAINDSKNLVEVLLKK